jgi:hypothetical protein
MIRPESVNLRPVVKRPALRTAAVSAARFRETIPAGGLWEAA